jgi:hypothetical protein
MHVSYAMISTTHPCREFFVLCLSVSLSVSLSLSLSLSHSLSYFLSCFCDKILLDFESSVNKELLTVNVTLMDRHTFLSSNKRIQRAALKR